MNEPPIDRKKLSFRQAEGLAALPTQLQPRALSNEMRSVLYAVVFAEYNGAKSTGSYGGPKIAGRWRNILERWNIFELHRPIDEFEESLSKQVASLKNLMFTGRYDEIFEFLTFIIRDPQCPPNFVGAIQKALAYTRAGYRIAEKTFMPIASVEEGEAIGRAFADLDGAEFGGARAHLKEAGTLASAGDWAGSVRESIHAVEAVARLISPGSETLGPAIKALKASHHMHPALAEGLLKIYGFTNDEQGIRHPLLDDQQSKVDETDALYMLGACAAFVSYLIARRPVP